MKRFRKSIAVGMAVVMSLGSMGILQWGVTAEASGLPTTDGHDKYVNEKVFSVIGSDTFGSTPLDAPLFDKTQGSQDISDLQVPTLAYDESSIGLVWSKPEKYDNVADYNVYINGQKAETARENFKVNAEWTAKYMEAFYDYYVTQGKSDIDMVNVDIHSYRATGLQADKEYTFKVVAVDKDGNELGTAKEIKAKTTAAADIVNVVDYGAKTIEQWNAAHSDKTTGSSNQGFVDYDEEKNAFIEANTSAIQKAIDECPEGGKVVVPEGTFMSGAVWLKSDMTLEVNGTIWASPNSDHFEIGFLMYPFYTDTRGWGLINAMSADESAPITNVRVTGSGTLYGNGWKYGAGDTIYGDGYTPNTGVNTQAGDPSDTENWGLPRYMGGNNKKVFYYGIQSADSAKKYLANVMNEDGTRKYSDDLIDGLAGRIKEKNSDSLSEIDSTDITNAYATRSSLLIMRNCENVYVGDITIENPSNHSVNILDSRNIATTNVKVFSFDGNNGDGLGFGCSQNVICWNNFTDTGDDNLGFGASVGEGARDSEIQTNSEVWMFDNFIREGHGGLAAGSHTGNGIQDVLFEDTVMNHIDMAFRFKSAPTNGGFGANITMRDCAVADTQQGWVMTTSYSDANSASVTEFAEIGEFYNFASYNVSVYGVQSNTVQVLADVDPVSNPQKPWHTHHNLYFQDITFGNVGTNGGFKNKNGWESLIGCENSVFYNFVTKSYNSKAVSKGTDAAWNNLQYCKDIQFQGTTLDVSASKDSLESAILNKLNNIMSGITVADKRITAENYVEEVPEDPSGETEAAWTKKAKEASDFFNDASKLDSSVKTPKYEDAPDKDDVGYIWDNAYNDGKTSYADKLIGFAYPDCDIKDLAKLSFSFSRYGTNGTQKVSVRLDSKDGAEIASTILDASDKDYHDYIMDVTLPENVDTTKTHKLFVVFTSTQDSQKYIGNAKTLTGYTKASSEVVYETVSVDILNNGSGMTAGTAVSAGMYGTVMSLENATVKFDYLDETTQTGKKTVTIADKTYTDFVQAETAASAGGAIPDAGTATFVFTPDVDCSVTLHNKATGKTWWFIESPDGANVTNKATAGSIEDSMTFNLKAGKTYYYYCQGSKPMVYGIYFNAPVDNADSLLKEETSTDIGGITQSGGEKKVKLSWTAVDNGDESTVYYGVDIYAGDQKIDIVDGITNTETIISRLSSGVEYTFKVYVSEKGDNANSMSTTGWNKTYLGETKFTVEGAKDTAAIVAPEDALASASDAFYTHAQGEWTNISASDARVRGYKIYVNGDYKKTIYNYEIAKYDTLQTISKQIGRLTPGMENQIEVVAFTDAGVEYKMSTKATTLENYDYKAPIFAENASLTAAKQENGDVVLTWTAATDDTKVGGYRVYVDGQAVVPEGQDVFNPVNGAKTTTETTYTVKGLDLTKDHTFTVQAGDTWWKAETTMGTFDKMAGFNWTNKGLTVELKVEADIPDVPDTPDVNVPVKGEAADDVKDSVITGDAVAKDEATGEIVDITEIFLNVDNANEAQKAEIANALAKLQIALSDADYYDISLVTKSGAAVKLESGKIRITLGYKSGMDMSKFDVAVYHLKDNGELEKLAVTAGEESFSFETDSFSLYAAVYTEKQAAVDPDQPEDQPDQTTPAGGESAQTGDSNRTFMFVIMLAAAIALMAGVAVVNVKKRALK